jgi:hypothetical protein
VYCLVLADRTKPYREPNWCELPSHPTVTTSPTIILPHTTNPAFSSVLRLVHASSGGTSDSFSSWRRGNADHDLRRNAVRDQSGVRQMPSTIKETEEQRRRRVAGRIRNELLGHLLTDLVELARVRKLPDQWMSASALNQLLDESGYWAAHRHVMASFLSSGACESVVARALELLVNTHPDVWARAGREYKPAGRDWNAYAAAKANLIRRDYPAAGRTALHTGSDGASVLFAHDNYQSDSRARREVTLLRQDLRAAGIPELGFGVSDDGRTWVMVVWSQDEAALGKALFNAWEAAFGEDEEIKFE